MLHSIEITAALTGPRDDAHLTLLWWDRRIELSLDCFVCERRGRTTVLEWGAERAVCSSDEEHGAHFAPARIAAFDVTRTRDGVTATAVVDHWWSPFHDARRDTAGRPLPEVPWVRLAYGYRCPHHEATGAGSTQTNLVRPLAVRCTHCGSDVATDVRAPTVRVLP